MGKAIHEALVLWTDKCRATLDGQDDGNKGWVIEGRQPEVNKRRQQGGEGTMVWAGIMGSNVVGSFRILESVKIDWKNYFALLKDNLIPWIDKHVSNKEDLVLPQRI